MSSTVIWAKTNKRTQIFLFLVYITISINPVFSSNEKPSCLSVFERSAQEAEYLKKKKSIAKILSEISLKLEKFCIKTFKANLDESICGGAAPALAAILRKDYKIPATVVSAKNFRHFYVIIPDYFKKNIDLIIDPTIRHFFDEYSNFQNVPKIFSGDRKDFLNLFLSKKINKKALALYNEEKLEFINSYLLYLNSHDNEDLIQFYMDLMN